MSEKSCSYSSAPKLIFPCSGASNVGEIADHAGRKLTKEGVGKMHCLAGLGGRVSGIMASADAAGKILAIDGCPSDCAKNTLQQAGFLDFEHLRVTDLGLVKGESQVNDENVEKVALEGASVLLKSYHDDTYLEEGKMKTLAIIWQRLVGDSGQTCDRCGTTQEEVRKAHKQLRASLSPLDIDVVLEEKTLSATDDIVQSNRIWIAGKPLETWLNATFGTSDCSSCGSLVGEDVACRTITVDERVYESIPSELIVKAALIAAADLMTAPAATSTCCSSEGSPAEPSGDEGCCSTGCCCS